MDIGIAGIEDEHWQVNASAKHQTVLPASIFLYVEVFISRAETPDHVGFGLSSRCRDQKKP